MTDSSPLTQQLAAALGDGYDVVRELGNGGFAVVFLVKDLGLKRDLAVKVLSPDMITSNTVIERFRREAEMIARLPHPNIVPLHFIGQKDTLLFIAMQCVDGGSIADRLKADGPLPVADVVRVISEVASALAHMHRHGVVHRDVKPANILIDSSSGRSLVTDFGIARSGDATGLTSTGMMIGTPAYLSPEQVTGDASDHRVDIYALGVTAYEMLVGHVPYDGNTPTAAMLMRLTGPPAPVDAVRGDVPATLAAVISKCLAADQAARYDSAEDVVQALSSVNVVSLRGTSVTRAVAEHARRTIRQPSRALIMAATTLAIVATASVLLRRSPRTDDAAVQPIAATTARPPVGDMTLIAIPAGNYSIGTDDGPPLTRPRHVVNVRAFRIERTEVTVDAYDLLVSTQRAPTPWGLVKPFGALPVTRVPWGDAANYCALRYPGSGRLPSEIEWEAAARGLAAHRYPHGDSADGSSINAASAHRDAPAPVGSFPRGATPEGLQDLSGNVWEWTSSALQAYPGGAPLPDSMAQYRVIRGGAFDTQDSLATGWIRGYLKAASTAAALPKVGFRCATSALASEARADSVHTP